MMARSTDRVPAGAENHRAPGERVRLGGVGPSPEESSINILIVDDEPKNLTVLETILTDPRYRLVRAETADQALMALLADEFAVLILDVNMPGTTGFELAQMVRQRKKTSEVPIIFLTAYFNEDQHVIEGYDSGAVDYLHKPINPAILRSKVSVLVELHIKQRQLESANSRLSAEVTERRLVQEQLHELNETLEQRVKERTEAHQLAEQQIRLLMNEVNHRSKNLLSVVMAIAHKTVASSPDEFMVRFSNRIQALAVNHDLLVKNQWQRISVAELVLGQLAHFGDLIDRRVSIEGPHYLLSAKAAQAVGMALHELSTNAIKHGALSGETGMIEVRWRIDGSRPSGSFHMSWTERNGTKIPKPERRGFGTTVITKMVELSVGGRTEVEFAKSGLVWRMSCPIEGVSEPETNSVLMGAIG
jgi:two-component sensor histidine kinase/CheY-like chemotaxis protein